MREIKFRYVFESRKKVTNIRWETYIQMAYLTLSHIEVNGVQNVLSGFHDVSLPTTQNRIRARNLYTGFKDKNDVEIYKGDIVAWCNDLIGEEVIFKNGGFTIESVGYYGKVNWKACRIIGNQYENPKL